MHHFIMRTCVLGALALAGAAQAAARASEVMAGFSVSTTQRGVMRSANGSPWPYLVGLSIGVRDKDWKSWNGQQPGRRLWLGAKGAAEGSDPGFRVYGGGFAGKNMPYPAPSEYTGSFSLIIETGIDET